MSVYPTPYKPALERDPFVTPGWAELREAARERSLRDAANAKRIDMRGIWNGVNEALDAAVQDIVEGRRKG